MDIILFTISSLVGLTIGILVMGILFAVNLGRMDASIYITIGLAVGTVSGLSIYGLLDKIK